MEKNQKQFQWSNEEYPPDVDTDKPLYSRFHYVKDLGKTQDFSQIQKKEMGGLSNLKSLKQIEQGAHFMEGLGFDDTGGGAASIESVKYGQLAKELESLKSTQLAQPQPYMLMHAKFALGGGGGGQGMQRTTERTGGGRGLQKQKAQRGKQ